MKIRLYRETKETFSIEVEASSIEEANRKLENGDFDSEDWDPVNDSLDTENKPDWSQEAE